MQFFFSACVPFQTDQSVHSSHNIGKRLFKFSSQFQEIASYSGERKFCSVSSTTKYKVRYECVSISLKNSALVFKFKRLSLSSSQTGNVCFVACLNVHSLITATHKLLLQEAIYVQKKPIIEFGEPETCLKPLSSLDQTASIIMTVGTV